MELKDYLIISFIVLVVVIFIIYYIRKYHHSKESYSAFPTGTIIIWVPPSTATVPLSAPPGWAVCDGKNGTPDLRGRFLLGANPMPGSTTSTSLLTDNKALPAYSYSTTSGTTTTSFNLTVANMPPHNHSLPAIVNDGVQTFPVQWGGGMGQAGAVGPNGMNAYNGIYYTNDNGQGTPVAGVNIMPPFYTVIYIMKL